MLVLPRSRQQPGVELPEVDWSNPVTKGLVFCAFPVATTYFDAVTRVFGTPTGALTAGIRARNAGYSNDVASYAVAGASGTLDSVLWPISSTLRGATLVQTGTLLALGGSTIQTDGQMYTLGGNTEAVTIGDGFSLSIDSFQFISRGDILKTNYSNSVKGHSAAAALGNPFNLKTHFFGYTFNANGANGNWLYQGGVEAYSGQSTHGTTITNRRAVVLTSSSGSTGTTGDVRVSFVNLFLMWDREITALEYLNLYYNPWQLLRARQVILPAGFVPPLPVFGSVGDFDTDLILASWF